jgi:hypothetical protein
MLGIVTRHAGDRAIPEFQRTYFEAKDVSGRASAPIEDAINTISCFGDNATAMGNPELVAVDADGRRADADHGRFDWAAICPTHPEYRAGLHEMITEATATGSGIRLDDVGFPAAEFCRCDRCERSFAEAATADRTDWRASVITDFIQTAFEPVRGDRIVSIHADPYPGHLRTHTGVDLVAVAPFVDTIVVPLYDPAYATTYWLDALAAGFRDRLADLDLRLAVELYAVDVRIDALIGAMHTVDPYVDEIILGYDSSTATAAVRRMQADEITGTAYGPRS